MGEYVIDDIRCDQCIYAMLGRMGGLECSHPQRREDINNIPLSPEDVAEGCEDGEFTSTEEE